MRRCDACIVVTLSGKLSGSYNSARVARDMVLEESPGKQIHILDSESASAGELRLALYLKERIDAGEDFDTVVEKSTVLWNPCGRCSSLRIWGTWSKTDG